MERVSMGNINIFLHHTSLATFVQKYDIQTTPRSYQIPGSRWALQWRHNDHDCVSSHQPHGCLLNRSFGRRSNRKHQSSASLAFEREIHRRPLNSPQKGPVTRKMFQFDDVIMDFFYSVTCLGWEIVTFWFVCMAFSKSLLPMYIIELVWFNCTCNQIFPAIMQSLVNEPDCLFNSLSSG